MATGIMIGLAVARATSGLVNAERQAKAIAKQGAAEAERGKQITLAKAGKQKASFLSSGITLESGTVQGVLSSTFDVGKADVEQGISNANTRARNIVGSARTSALGSLAMTAANLDFGGTPVSDIDIQTDPFQGITKTGTAPRSRNICG